MITITSPVNGEVLTHRNGRVTDGGLSVEVRGHVKPATSFSAVFVNDTPAQVAANGAFQATVRVTEPETDLVTRLEASGGPAAHQIRVLWNRHSRPRYRFAIDDNIFFLRDLARTRPASIFDHFYLRGLRDLHQRYGTKFVLNTFFTTPEADFTLAQMPDGWRGEFADHAGWLSLAFHAYAEFPDRPYQHATAAKLAADYDLVAGELRRFAGDTAFSPTTVTHWGMVAPEAWGVLAARGTRVLSGFFVPNTGSSYTGDGESIAADLAGDGYDINYCLDTERSAFLSRHDLIKDFASGLLFSRGDIVCNNTPPEQAERVLLPLMADPATAEIMDLVTHEQYFWPSYFNYRPDHFARCEAAIRCCAENGYEPVFLHEGLAGAGPEK
jgi:hypothetical protein